MVSKQKSRRMPKESRRSLKMWANGAREMILMPHIEPYADALDRGWIAERHYHEMVCNEYHARIDWRLEDHEEPPLPLAPYNPSAIPPDETLTDGDRGAKIERIKMLNERIRRWLKYRVKRIRRFYTSRMDIRKDPYAILLGKLAGLNAPPKARQAYQQYMHERYHQELEPTVKDAWQEKQWSEHVMTDSLPNAAFRAKIARSIFANLSKEQQDYWADRAKAEADAAREAYEEGLKCDTPKTLEERQRCIDNIPAFLGPIMRGLQAKTKLKFVILYGGPFPCNEGEISMNHINYGRSLSADQSYFFQWKDNFLDNYVMPEYARWLRTCYSSADIAEAAMPKPVDLSKAKYRFDDDSDDDECHSATDASDDSDIVTSDEEDHENNSTRKKKKKKVSKYTRKSSKKNGDMSTKEGKSATGNPSKKPSARTPGDTSSQATSSGSGSLQPTPAATVPPHATPTGPQTSLTTPVADAPMPEQPQPQSLQEILAAALALAAQRQSHPPAPTPQPGGALAVPTSSLPSPSLPADKSTTLMDSPAGSYPPTPNGSPRNKRPLPEIDPSLMEEEPVQKKRRSQPRPEPPSPRLIHGAVAEEVTPPNTTAGGQATPSMQMDIDLQPISVATTPTLVSAAETTPSSTHSSPKPSPDPTSTIPISKGGVPTSTSSPPATNPPPISSPPADEPSHPASQPPRSVPEAETVKATGYQNATQTGDSSSRSDLTTDPVPDQQTTSTGNDDPLPLCPRSAPKWVHEALNCLTQTSLGSEYNDILRLFLAIEAAHGYSNPNRGFPVPGRPILLSRWISAGRWRAKHPVVSNPDEFGSIWWDWWSTLQPSWRKMKQRPPSRSRYGESWDSLLHPGQNGVLSVVATLYWWGIAVNGEGVPGPAYASWLTAVADVTWMLEGLSNHLDTRQES